MLIGLGLLVIAILFGGPQNDLILTHIDKDVKKIVVEESRKSIVISELKEVKKLQKSYNKQTKKYIKQLGKLIDQQSSTHADYNAFFNSVVEYENKTNELFIPHRLIIQKTLTDNEWNGIVDAIKKDLKKDVKAKDKLHKSFDKSMAKMGSGITKSVPEEKSNQTQEILDNFKDRVIHFANDIYDQDQSELEILLKREATGDELLTVLNDDIQSWLILFDEFSTLHNELAKVVPEKNWKPVAKELKKLF